MRNALARMASAAVVAAACVAAGPARAAGPFDRPVDTQRLAAVRGGFATQGRELDVSFGLQRTVLVDGVPVAQAEGASTLLVLQRGPNNAFAVAPGAVAGIAIQNSLDGQKLQAVTTLDVTTNSLQAFRGAALQSQIRASLTDSIRR